MANKDKPCIPLLVLTAIASGAVTAKRFVTHAGVQAATAGELVMGIAQIDAVSGDPYPVTTEGTEIVEAGAAIAAGAELTTDAQGRAITAATAGHQIRAIALEAATGAGKFIEVRMAHNGRVPSA